MSNLRTLGARRLCASLPALFTFLTVLTFHPAQSHGFQSRSIRGALSRARAMQAAQKKQTVQELKAELQAAQTTFSQAESALATSSASLQTAKSQLDSARERYDAGEKEAHEAGKAQKSLEEKLIASQSPDSPVGKIQSQLVAAQLDLDKEIHRVLSLPDHPAGVTEADRAAERLKFSESQKSRLKGDAGFVSATAKVDALHEQLKDAHKTLFESDAGWKEAHETRKGLTQDLKAMEENRKAAAAEVAQHTKQVKTAQATAGAARQVIMNATMQLTSLGEKVPAAPPAKK